MRFFSNLFKLFRSGPDGLFGKAPIKSDPFAFYWDLALRDVQEIPAVEVTPIPEIVRPSVPIENLFEEVDSFVMREAPGDAALTEAEADDTPDMGAQLSGAETDQDSAPLLLLPENKVAEAQASPSPAPAPNTAPASNTAPAPNTEVTATEDTPALMTHGTSPLIAPIGASPLMKAMVGSVLDKQMHGSDPAKMGEHMAVLDLVPRTEASHIAVKDGDWFDPKTWHTGEIPGRDAKVLIPDDIHVTYDKVKNVGLFTVRVDGTLEFATDTDSRMVFDTMVVSPTGLLQIGTEDQPVEAGVSVELIVDDNGRIDTGWDPMLLSRGIVSHGAASIHGAVKDSHEKVLIDPLTGDTSVRFAEIPEGWEIGDQIVIAGTRFDGHKWDNTVREKILHPNEDEIRTITDIRGSRVYFEEPLEYDHDTPRSDLKTSVANYSRSVTVSTRNADEVETHERGHVMFMHSDAVDVRYAAFRDLGRTDKSINSDDISNFGSVDFDTNVQGRYSLHLHRTGTDDLKNPAMVIGNAVWGSPGWGFVQHDSNAILQNNASFDTFGAGYVAETGNETGAWDDNIAIFAAGVDWGAVKVHSRIGDNIFDTGRSGDGFWFQGRLIDATDNVAASVNHGFVYFHRDGDDRMLDFPAQNFAYPGIFFGDQTLSPTQAPILVFEGNETFAANQGLHIVKATPIQGHDIWTRIEDLAAWSVKDGVFLEYTTHYFLKNIDVIAKEETSYSPPEDGIMLGRATGDIVVIDSRIDGFRTGISFNNEQEVGDPIPRGDTNYTIVNAQITNTDTPYVDYDPSINTITTRKALNGGAPDLKLGPLYFTDLRVEITGTKTDGLGKIEFPSGIEDEKLGKYDVAHILADRGYWRTSEGETYFLLDIHFSDRLTGRVYYETHQVVMDPIYNIRLGYEKWDFADAKYMGVADIVTDSQGITRSGTTVLDQAVLARPKDTSPALAPPTDDHLTDFAAQFLVSDTLL